MARTRSTELEIEEAPTENSTEPDSSHDHTAAFTQTAPMPSLDPSWTTIEDTDKVWSALYEKLSAPIPASEIHLDPNQNPYISGETVITRLNTVVGIGNWSFTVIEHKIETVGDKREVVVLGELNITIKGERYGGSSRQQFGGQRVQRELGDALKGAATDAFKKCASMFGVGRELYVKGGDRQAFNGSYNPPAQSFTQGQGTFNQARAASGNAPTCDDCGAPIDGWNFPDGNSKSPQDVANIGTRKFGRPLCNVHYKAANSGAPRPAPRQVATQEVEQLPF